MIQSNFSQIKYAELLKSLAGYWCEAWNLLYSIVIFLLHASIPELFPIWCLIRRTQSPKNTKQIYISYFLPVCGSSHKCWVDEPFEYQEEEEEEELDHRKSKLL